MAELQGVGGAAVTHSISGWHHQTAPCLISEHPSCIPSHNRFWPGRSRPAACCLFLALVHPPTQGELMGGGACSGVTALLHEAKELRVPRFRTPVTNPIRVRLSSPREVPFPGGCGFWTTFTATRGPLSRSSTNSSQPHRLLRALTPLTPDFLPDGRRERTPPHGAVPQGTSLQLSPASSQPSALFGRRDFCGSPHTHV